MKQSELYDDFKDLVLLDVKAEKIASLLLDKGLPSDKVIVRPIGWNDREFSSDVVWSNPVHRIEDFRTISVNRNGLYDRLPEGLFHKPFNIPADSSDRARSILADIKNFQSERDLARLLLLPFDATLFADRMEADEEDERFCFENELKLIWDEISSEVDSEPFSEECLRFRRILPEIRALLGSFQYMETILSFVLMIPTVVAIEYSPTWVPIEPQEDDAIGCLDPKLGEHILGQDMILGRGVWESSPHVFVTLGPLSDKDLVKLVTEQESFFSLLQKMFAFLLPVHHVFDSSHLNLLADPRLYNFCLDSVEWHSRLGYTTILAMPEANEA